MKTWYIKGQDSNTEQTHMYCVLISFYAERCLGTWRGDRKINHARQTGTEDNAISRIGSLCCCSCPSKLYWQCVPSTGFICTSKIVLFTSIAFSYSSSSPTQQVKSKSIKVEVCHKRIHSESFSVSQGSHQGSSLFTPLVKTVMSAQVCVTRTFFICLEWKVLHTCCSVLGRKGEPGWACFSHPDRKNCTKPSAWDHT